MCTIPDPLSFIITTYTYTKAGNETNSRNQTTKQQKKQKPLTPVLDISLDKVLFL